MAGLNRAGTMIELEIEWDGNVNGLAEHRLSVAAFGKPLHLFLAALRRKASNMLRESISRKETNVGRLAAEADQIDIEIGAIRQGSSGVNGLISVQLPPGQQPLWPEGLAADAIGRLIDDIEAESRGVRRNERVRKYLGALHPGITKQYYALRVDGTVEKELTLGSVAITPDLGSLPYLVEHRGRVVGVGFDPGRHFVRIKTSNVDNSEVTLSATQAQVERALEVRGEDVRILALSSANGKKLLRIQVSNEPPIRLDVQAYVFDKWSETLERLSR